MFEAIERFEQALAKFTGAPYAVMTDCCTHAIELAFRLDRVQQCEFTPFTYLSVPMTMHKLGVGSTTFMVHVSGIVLDVWNTICIVKAHYNV